MHEDEPSRERVTLRVPRALRERLDAVADRSHGGNRSEAARTALKAYVDAHEPDERVVVGDWPTADGPVVVGGAVRDLEPDAGR